MARRSDGGGSDFEGEAPETLTRGARENVSRRFWAKINREMPALTSDFGTSVQRRCHVGIASVRPYARNVISAVLAPRVHKDEQAGKVCAVLREGRPPSAGAGKRKRPGGNRGALIRIY